MHGNSIAQRIGYLASNVGSFGIVHDDPVRQREPEFYHGKAALCLDVACADAFTLPFAPCPRLDSGDLAAARRYAVAGAVGRVCTKACTKPHDTVQQRRGLDVGAKDIPVANLCQAEELGKPFQSPCLVCHKDVLPGRLPGVSRLILNPGKRFQERVGIEVPIPEIAPIV